MAYNRLAILPWQQKTKFECFCSIFITSQTTRTDWISLLFSRLKPARLDELSLHYVISRSFNIHAALSKRTSRDPLLSLKEVKALVDDEFVALLHRIAGTDSVALELLSDFFDKVFAGVEPDSVYRLRVLLSSAPTIDKGQLFGRFGQHWYSEDLLLNYSSVPQNPGRRFAISMHPLVGKSTLTNNNKKYVPHQFTSPLSLAAECASPWCVAEAGPKDVPDERHYRIIAYICAAMGLDIYDVDDLYDWHAIKDLVEAEDWEESNRLKGAMLKQNAVDNALYLVHGELDAQALGAEHLGYITISEALLRERETGDKRPYYARMTKKGWIDKPPPGKHISATCAMDVTMGVAELLTPHFLIQHSVVGAGTWTKSFTDEQTLRHVKRLEKAKQDNEERKAKAAGLSIRMEHVKPALAMALNAGHYGFLAAILQTLWPESSRDIMLRARATPAFVAKFLLAVGPLASDWLDFVFEGEGLQGVGILVFSSLMLAYMSGGHKQSMLKILIPQGLTRMGCKGADSILKPLHEQIRRGAIVPEYLPNHTQGHYTELMYMTTLFGRYYDPTIADDGSIDNRTKFPGVHTASNDGKEFSYALHKSTFDRALATRDPAIKTALAMDRNLTIEDLMAEFLNIASAGSAASGKAELTHIETDQRLNKRVWLNELSAEQILNIPNLPAIVEGSAVNKLELNKIRQLLPGPVWHWLAESIVMHRIERADFASDAYISLEKSSKTLFIRFMERVFRDRLYKGTTTLDMDYADFNITHMISDMQKIYRNIAKHARAASAGSGVTFGDTDYAGFVARLCDWLVICLENLRMRADGGDGRIYQLVRGLWSGWRTTQYINTTMNSNYAKQARMCLSDILGYDPFIKMEGQGDDMDGIMQSLVDALLTVNYFNRAGHEMNPLKQLIGSYSNEYLRISGGDGTAHGNLCRSIGSFCSSDMQSSEIENGPETAVGASTAVDVLIRRGMPRAIGELLRDTCIRHFSRIRVFNITTSDIEHHHLDPEDAFIDGSSGGLGLSRHGTLPKLFDDKINADYKGIRPEGTIPGSLNHGTQALKRVVSKFLHDHNLAESVAEEVERAANMAVSELMLPSDVLNQTRNERKLAIVDYYKQCRSFRSKKMSIRPELPQRFKDIIDSTLSEVMDVENGQFRKLEGADIEDILDSAISAAIGPMSITPDIIHQLRDQDNSKLNVLQALEALDSPGAGRILGALHKFCTPLVIQYMIMHGGHSVMNTGGLIPAELNTVIKDIQLRVLNAFVQDVNDTDITYEQWRDLMRATNEHMMTVYDSKYYELFRL
uniref:RNA-directed RNA polymerase n=1 Tax=Rhizoctonia solani phlegivirus 4 TaxID=3162548 RepID=A0A8F4X4Z4_9VIRU|nr:RNA-dependent RNA polymerase [Rhizoctonia solani dsRNA virus 18]